MTGSSWSASHPGGRRSNEDTVLTTWAAGGTLLLVCDGVGGRDRGHEASKLAAETIAAHLDQASDASCPDRLKAGLLQAHHAVVERQQRTPGSQMASTAAAAWIIDDRLVIAWSGDSRVGLIREGQLRWLTSDHKAASNAGLDQCIGHAEGAEPDTCTEHLAAGDRVLVCSDGLMEITDESALVKMPGNRMQGWIWLHGQLRQANRAQPADARPIDNTSLVIYTHSRATNKALRQLGAAATVVTLMGLMLSMKPTQSVPLGPTTPEPKRSVCSAYFEEMARLQPKLQPPSRDALIQAAALLGEINRRPRCHDSISQQLSAEFVALYSEAELELIKQCSPETFSRWSSTLFVDDESTPIGHLLDPTALKDARTTAAIHQRQCQPKPKPKPSDCVGLPAAEAILQDLSKARRCTADDEDCDHDLSQARRLFQDSAWYCSQSQAKQVAIVEELNAIWSGSSPTH